MATRETRPITKVLLQCEPGSSEPIIAKFNDCVLQKLGIDDIGGDVICSTEDGILRLKYDKTGEMDSEALIPIQHSPMCPFLALPESVKLSPEIIAQGISVAVAVLVISCDEYVLLTRRPEHMRTFPGVWVPPGGHVEEGESLETAAIRELKEETGITINSESTLKKIGVWESVFPPLLDWGLPKRHHLIVYFLANLNKPYQELTAEFQLDPQEISIATWLGVSFLQTFFQSDLDFSKFPDTLEITTVSLSEPQKTIEVKPQTVFSRKFSIKNRITVGTEFILLEWLKYLKEKKKPPSIRSSSSFSGSPYRSSVASENPSESDDISLEGLNSQL